MKKANQYAELHAQITELEAKAKALEPEVIAELGDKKRVDTEFGRVTTVETKIYTYSETIQRKEKSAKEKIKEFSENLINEIDAAKRIEEKYLTPQIRVGLHFALNKEEKWNNT